MILNNSVKVLMTSISANPAVLPQFWTNVIDGAKNHVIPVDASGADFFNFIEKRGNFADAFGDLDLSLLSKDFSSLKTLFDQLSEDQLHPVAQ